MLTNQRLARMAIHLNLPNKSNKYGARKTEYNGVMYDSKRESEYARELDLRVRAHDILSWQRQVKYPMIVKDIKITTYVADFVITHNNGHIEIVDIKGVETPVFKLKAKLLKALYVQDNEFVTFNIIK